VALLILSVLFPIFAFDEQGGHFLSPMDDQPLKDYWGYDPICHFAPHPAYCLSSEEQSFDFVNRCPT
jgi:pullulanase/glycogen debranching enzyme